MARARLALGVGALSCLPERGIQGQGLAQPKSQPMERPTQRENIMRIPEV